MMATLSRDTDLPTEVLEEGYGDLLTKSDGE